MWACAIDEHCEHDAARRATNRALVASHPDAQYMVGVRLARNRQLHDLTTDITQAYSGLTFPLKFPLRFQGWQWRRLSQLPPPGRRQRPAVEQAYEVHSPAERLSRPSNASRAHTGGCSTAPLALTARPWRRDSTHPTGSGP
jgi:hypothetical protein